jgi:hypothetical protein
MRARRRNVPEEEHLMSAPKHGMTHCVSEWSFASGRPYADPFNEIEVEALFRGPQGQTWRVPAYWAGGQEWRVRFAPPEEGRYTYTTLCSDPTNADLHGQEGTLVAHPYTGHNPLLQHGPLRVSATCRTLEYADGTPFFWLGDTWWMALCQRLRWPDEFQLLVADRVAKGFSVIQIVAGLYPDMPAFDPRGYNEAGHPWEADYARLNPAYWEMADLRLGYLVQAGLLPMIVGCWGYHLLWLGEEAMKKHWRNLIARYGAYPVVWCLAGEGAMPYYASRDKVVDKAQQIRGWTELARFVRELDPYHHPITIHPTDSARTQIEDEALLDLDMLQTGHGGWESVPNTVEKVRAAVARTPTLPVIEGEVNYEGIMESSREEVQRLLFWSCLLNGAAGYTYGANGLWQLNRPEQPYGASPHGASWGDTPWQEAYRLPGSMQLGLGKRLLQRWEWWRFLPHPEWVEPRAAAPDYLRGYAAGIPGMVRVFYFARPLAPWSAPVHLHELEKDVTYRAFFWDPSHGREYPVGLVRGPEPWRVPQPPIMRDWVLVLEQAT